MVPPIYEYVCSACKKTEERFLHYSEAGHPQICAVCSTPMEKIISIPMGYSINGDNSGSTKSKHALTGVKVKGKK